MSWKGEKKITEYFGLRGFKCLCEMMMDEINLLREKAGLPKRNWSDVLNKMDTLMIKNKGDDEGPDLVEGKLNAKPKLP